LSAFERALRQLLERVPQARAASLLGTDGIPVETWGSVEEGVSIEAVAAEMGRLLKAAGSAAVAGGSREVREVATVTDRSIAVLSRVTGEYYLLLLLARDGSLGRGRFELARAAAALEEELL
jgi:predicted regulator of Ras-like GTPase activity (Roadblock/LC7/MglB family)